jgi:hypothetical protein
MSFHLSGPAKLAYFPLRDDGDGENQIAKKAFDACYL